MTAANHRGRVLISGGSLGGLMAGAMLLRAGWEVQIYERVSGDIATRGTGMATHDKLFEALRRAGMHIDAQIGSVLMGRTAYDRSGREISHVPHRQILSPWSIHYRRLRETVPAACYHLGKEVRRVQSGPSGAVVRTVEHGLRLGQDLLTHRRPDAVSAPAICCRPQFADAGHHLVDKARHLGCYLEGNRRSGPPAAVLPIEELMRDSGRG